MSVTELDGATLGCLENEEDASLPLACHATRALPGTLRVMLMLALTMILAQLAPLLMSLYVAGLIGHLGNLSFSAYSMVNSMNVTVFIAVSSFLQGLYYVGGRAIGRDEVTDYRAAIQAGCAIALATGLLAITLSLLAGRVFAVLGVDHRIIDQIGTLGVAAAAGILPAQMLVVFRVHAALNERAGLVTIIQVLGAVITAICATWVIKRCSDDANRAVLYVVLAVALVQWLMLVASLLSVQLMRRLHFGVIVKASGDQRFRPMLRMVWQVGWPIGAVVFLDSLTSFVSTLLVGRNWLEAVPVHSVVWLWIVVSLVVPLGLAQAATQRVAIAHSRNDFASRNLVVVASLLLSALFGAVIVLVFTLFPTQIGGLLLATPSPGHSADPRLAVLMPLGGVVLALQAVIIVGAANLRGIGLTKAPLFLAFIGYIVVATGAQYLLAVVLQQGPRGIWWGLIIGFAATAIAVLWRCSTEFRIHAAQSLSED